MNAPEPLDEFSSAPAETRGGDHLADITVAEKQRMILEQESGDCTCCEIEDDENE